VEAREWNGGLRAAAVCASRRKAQTHLEVSGDIVVGGGVVPEPGAGMWRRWLQCGFRDLRSGDPKRNKHDHDHGFKWQWIEHHSANCYIDAHSDQLRLLQALPQPGWIAAVMWPGCAGETTGLFGICNPSRGL